MLHDLKNKLEWIFLHMNFCVYFNFLESFFKVLPTFEHFVFEIIIFIKYLYYNAFGFIKNFKCIIKYTMSYL